MSSKRVILKLWYVSESPEAEGQLRGPDPTLFQGAWASGFVWALQGNRAHRSLRITMFKLPLERPNEC